MKVLKPMYLRVVKSQIFLFLYSPLCTVLGLEMVWSSIHIVKCRPAKSRDRCDRRSREIFIFWGNLGKFFIFPSGNCHISPLKSSPFGKFLMFLVGKLLFNKHTNKIRLFMWLLQETNKIFAKCCSFYLRPFWGNFNPKNTGWVGGGCYLCIFG